MDDLIIPNWLIRVAVALVWFYEGLWCKLLNGKPRELEVVKAVPRYGPQFGAPFLMILGVAEITIAAWVISGDSMILCAIIQTLLLVLLNGGGLIWSRHLIDDPGGMVIKNLAFLILAWVAAGPNP